MNFGIDTMYLFLGKEILFNPLHIEIDMLKNEVDKMDGLFQGYIKYDMGNYILNLMHSESMKIDDMRPYVKFDLKGDSLIHEGAFSISEDIVKYCTRVLEKDIPLSYLKITRLDLNTYTNHTFLETISYESFLTKSKKFSVIGTMGNIETFYLGDRKKKTLRVYNKTKELMVKRYEKDLPYEKIKLEEENFLRYDIDIDLKKDVYNVEIEFRRDYLRGKGIDNINDLKTRIVPLWKDSLKSYDLISYPELWLKFMSYNFIEFVVINEDELSKRTNKKTRINIPINKLLKRLKHSEYSEFKDLTEIIKDYFANKDDWGIDDDGMIELLNYGLN